jgi:8-oxo-dGTP pyrophosphatase MutT (NUDIX family)
MYKVFHNHQTLIFSEELPCHPDGRNGLIVLPVNKVTKEIASIQIHLNPGQCNTLWIMDPGFEVYERVFIPSYYPVTAAGGLVYNAHGEVLLIRRHQMWDLPKGKADPDESPYACAFREVKEETGVACLPRSEKPILTKHIYYRNDLWQLKTTYWYKMEALEPGILIPQKEEGITEVEWKPINFILNKEEKAMWPLIREVVRNIEQ